MNEEELKDYKKHVLQRKNDYNRIRGFVMSLEENGLDIPKLQYTKHIKNILDVMEHEDKRFIAKPSKPVQKKKKLSPQNGQG